MGIEAITEFHIIAFFAKNLPLLYFLAFLVPVLLLAGLRFRILLRDQKAWILTGIRVLLGYLPLVLSFLIAFPTIYIVLNASPETSQLAGFVIATISGIIIGVIIAYHIGRKVESSVSTLLERKSLSANREQRYTDIRTASNRLPVQQTVDHSKEFELARQTESVFLGIDEDGQSVTIDRSTWKRSHVQIMGPPGSGKGVHAAVTLSQSLLYGDAIYIFDPKKDEWAPSVFRSACKQASVPFHFVNLQDHIPQLNPLLHASGTDISELFYAAFQLSSRGEAADFYRLGDREAARQTAELASRDSLSLSELPSAARSELDKEVLKSAQGFLAHLDEVASVTGIQTREGVDLSAPLHHGGCIYIVGSTRNEPLVCLQKLIFVRLIQLIEQQVNPEHHVSIFLDEFKYLLSAPAINALGTIRDKGCNILLAHQSPGDFGQCGADLSPDSVRATVTDTTPLKWLYRPADENTAQWISNQTGTIPAYQKHLASTRNPELAEIDSDSRRRVESSRNLIDTNMVLSLPNGAAVCVGADTARIAFTSPIVVDKIEMKPLSAQPVKKTEAILLKRVDSQSGQGPGLCKSTTDLAGPECTPEIRVLSLLHDVAWTHENIVAELLPELASEEVSALIDKLESSGAIGTHEQQSSYGNDVKIIGIRSAGVRLVEESIKPMLSGQQFRKTRHNPATMDHHLDQQRLRIAAERAGWTCWQKGTLGRRIVKGENYPDAVAMKPDGTVVAIELERTAKDIARYRKIIVAHLESRKQRLWDEIYYLFPDPALQERVARIFDAITELEYMGHSIQFTDEHRTCFQFFTFEDDWTE